MGSLAEVVFMNTTALRGNDFTSVYMVSSGLVGRGLRLRIPDVSTAYVADIFRGGCSNCWF